MAELASRGMSERRIAADIGCSLSTLRKHFRPSLPSDWAQPVARPLLRAISLGAGVQSTTMVLMAAAGELAPMPDVALFTDARAEPRFVYDRVAWLQSLTLPFPVRVIDGGDLGRDLVAGAATPSVAIPYFLSTGTPGGGRGGRWCTARYKVRPLAREHRRMLGPQRGGKPRPGSVEVWIGITTDEAHRMKPAQHAWQRNRFPLIEAGMSRRDCVDWLRSHDYPVPDRSACVFCPYRSDYEWRRLKECDPEGWQAAVRLDNALRDKKEILGLSADPYLHRSLQPLAVVQLDDSVRDRFGQECSGVCGT